MMKKIGLALISSVALYGQSLEMLAQKIDAQSLLLAQHKESIKIANEEIALSDIWENPSLSIGANDLLLDDITARDKEPMQTHFVTLSQKIPTSGKITLQKSIATIAREAEENIYHDSVLQLHSKLYLYGYKVAIINQKLRLIQKYKNNATRLKRVHTKRFAVGKSPQSSIEKSKILLKKLSIKERTLLTMKSTLLYKIEKITYEKVSSIEVALKMDKKLHIDIQKHPIMIASNLKVAQSKIYLELQKALKTPDVKLGLGYFQRKNRSDYLALNAGISLPVRGRETKAVQIATLKLQRAKIAQKSRQFTLQREVETYQALMVDAEENYHLISEEILPKQRYIQRLLQQEIFTKSVSITKLLDNLNESIVLELEAYDEMDRYFTAYAKLRYLEGELS